jgi:LPS export ABC transporter protein LptC
MRDFRRSKIEDGRKVWEILGDEANYYKDEKQAVIKNPRFLYYDKKGDVAETTGKVAKMFFNDKELEQLKLEGNIEVNYRGYTLKSEQAIYLPDEKRIVLPSRATVVTDGMAVEGSRMELELEDKKVRLLQNVKTKIEPDKLGNKKRDEKKQMNGG